MKIVKRILLGLLAVIVASILGFAGWAETPMGPRTEALAALKSDPSVIVQVGDFITFQPADKQPDTGFIFYPGGRVDYRSYAAPLHAIAEQGYLVVLVPVRLNLAFFDINAGAPAFSQFPEINHWAAGGHSLGGVASALFAKDHPEIEGLIFWASYPADDSLKNSDLKMLSIYGTNDMAGMVKFDETKPLLTSDARYVVIQGGNHAQFGDYGPQPGDNEATISRSEQQAQVVSATVEFLQELRK
ncbi:MAG: alpha/beta hydrolase [Chloroflexi bacterium]|nr:alpha/beta hydrolase [Chloroflexota bacterium]